MFFEDGLSGCECNSWFEPLTTFYTVCSTCCLTTGLKVWNHGSVYMFVNFLTCVQECWFSCAAEDYMLSDRSVTQMRLPLSQKHMWGVTWEMMQYRVGGRRISFPKWIFSLKISSPTKENTPSQTHTHTFLFSSGCSLLSLLDICWTSAVHQQAITKPTQNSSMCFLLTKGFWRLSSWPVEGGHRVCRFTGQRAGPLPSIETWAAVVLPMK